MGQQMTSDSMERGTHPGEDRLLLPLHGPARLTANGSTIRLRRKSLAILYYLALEGPSRRELLADMLWEHVDASQNLRVELHDLRRKLGALRVDAFAANADPLTLPATIRLDTSPKPGELLEGLEGVSPSFQTWLEEQRAKALVDVKSGFQRRDLVRATARLVRPPYLLIVSGQPDAGQQEFAAALARELRLPLGDELPAHQPAVRFLSHRRCCADETVTAMIADRQSVWVVEKPIFGEDSEQLLRLRAGFPPERVSYLELPPISWQELRAHSGQGLSFAEAARLFIHTGGHPGFLRELLALRRNRGNGSGVPLQLPQRVRAAYQLEARQLPAGARHALERASVHPGRLSENLLAALEVEPYLVELERANWLAFDYGWRFASHIPRTVIYLSLPRGNARLYHQRAAVALEAEGDMTGALHHRAQTELITDWPRLAEHSEGWARRVAAARSGLDVTPGVTPVDVVHVQVGEELPILESSRFGPGVDTADGALLIARQPLEAGASGAEWQLAGEAGLIHLSGRAFVANSLDVGIAGDAVPLRLELLGSSLHTVVFAAVSRPEVLADGTLLLPLHEEIDYRFRCEGALYIRLSSAAEAAVLDLRLASYRARGAGPFEAFDLTSLPKGHQGDLTGLAAAG